MIQFNPFRALRPEPKEAAGIVSPPYDVVDTKEARVLAQGKPNSFLRVVRSEIELPEDADPYGDAVYKKALENLERMIGQGLFLKDQEECYYIYRIISGSHRQTGLVGLASVDDYLNNKIKKHELTVKAKEDDRTNHIDRVNANTGPVFLTYRNAAVPGIAEFMDMTADNSTPLYDVAVENGDRHMLYRINNAEEKKRLHAHFASLDALYIADGHHRAASAARVGVLRRERGAAGKSHNSFMAVSFPDEQLRILPYNRVVRDLNGLSPEQFLERLGVFFEIREGLSALRMHEMNLYLSGKWMHMKVKPSVYEDADEIHALDVSVLQDHVLGPMLDITDPRTSKRIAFVGGIRGDEELIRLVKSGDFAAACSMFPTTVGQLIRIADAGKIMPPKSTWFEPKLKSGFLVHRLDY